MNFLWELRQASRECADPVLREALKNVAEQIHTALDEFYTTPTHDLLTRLNGHWAYGVRVLKKVTDGTTGGAGGAMKEGAELQRMVA